MHLIKLAVGILSAALIALAVWQLKQAEHGVIISTVTIEGIPATTYRPANGGPAPAVVIAHGFAGSQQLMTSFALAFARNGYIAITFDFAGHGRNTQPMSGDVNLIEGATRRLLEDVSAVAANARALGDGRIAVLGHSMASDIIVRFANSDPSVAATIAVSMFSPAVTAVLPRNLLVIAGAWEGTLKREALRDVGLVSAPQLPVPGITYGDFGSGTARRAAFSPYADHVSVLFNQVTMRESLDWLDQSFGVGRPVPAKLHWRGPWIIALLAGVVMLGWPLSALLPRVSSISAGAGLSWPSIWPGVVLPLIVTPLILRVLPTHFLPLLVGDYLAIHFFLYGFISFAWLLWQARGSMMEKLRFSSWSRFMAALLAVIAYGFAGLVWPLDTYVASFVPVGSRPMLVAVLLLGTLLYFLSDEWLSRGSGAARGAYIVTKLAFLLSLAIAVSLDPDRLFFLVIIVPVMVPFLIVYGLFSRWIYARTGQPLVAGAASALAFAWAIGVTFPLVSG
ncbi:alpha/beta hydrolase [Aestuariivirga sp.]|uniref:alpha/beta hydrolase n=1 Tax=Aestuariivirga sp. TaxID=2650926 RepID=UPI003BA85065